MSFPSESLQSLPTVEIVMMVINSMGMATEADFLLIALNGGGIMDSSRKAAILHRSLNVVVMIVSTHVVVMRISGNVVVTTNSTINMVSRNAMIVIRVIAAINSSQPCYI